MEKTNKKISLPKLNLDKLKNPPKQKKPTKIIQTLKEYIVENKLPDMKPDISAFPDLYKVILDDDKENDIKSEVAVLSGGPGTRLYASLLVANAEEERKKEDLKFKKEYEKLFGEIEKTLKNIKPIDDEDDDKNS